jgi:hypothetical protein
MSDGATDSEQPPESSGLKNLAGALHTEAVRYTLASELGSQNGNSGYLSSRRLLRES